MKTKKAIVILSIHFSNIVWTEEVKIHSQGKIYITLVGLLALWAILFLAVYEKHPTF